MNDFIVEFEILNYKMDSHNMKLPDKVLAFKLLDGTSDSENQRQMCLTLANDITYNRMKAACKHIFGDKINTSMTEQYNGNSITKQEESAMVFEQSKKKKVNHMDKQGKIARCVICNSKMHWAKNCPHKTNIKSINVAETISDDDNYDDDFNIILMTSEYEILINEMEVNAIIDTACTKTVSGKNWFHNFLKCLDDTALNKVTIVSSEKAFKFGYG